MNTLNQIVSWLDGKKAIILSVIMVIVPFMTSQGAISKEVGDLILTLSGIFLGGVKSAQIVGSMRKR